MKQSISEAFEAISPWAIVLAVGPERFFEQEESATLVLAKVEQARESGDSDALAKAVQVRDALIHEVQATILQNV